MTNLSNKPVAKAVVLTTGIGLQWIGDPLPAGTKLFTHTQPESAEKGHPRLTLGEIAIEELLQIGYTINGSSFERHTWPSHLHIVRLLAIWEDRSREASPADAMLLNKCIRELREVAKEMQK